VLCQVRSWWRHVTWRQTMTSWWRRRHPVQHRRAPHHRRCWRPLPRARRRQLTRCQSGTWRLRWCLVWSASCWGSSTATYTLLALVRGCVERGCSITEDVLTATAPHTSSYASPHRRCDWWHVAWVSSNRRRIGVKGDRRRLNGFKVAHEAGNFCLTIYATHRRKRR